MESTDHNRSVFDDERVAEYYVQFAGPTGGFLDSGEAAALVAAARSARNSAVLDVGVGSGRTTALLQLISDDYVAIDYAPNMVESFRRNFPDLPAHVSDARDLSEFADSTFGLVVFSNNGIDTVAHEDRVRVLRQFVRVLEPGGVVVFSTLNKSGPSFGEAPIQLHRPTQPIDLSPRNVIVAVGRRILRPADLVRGVRNWLRNRGRTRDHGTWAVAPLAAHDFAPVMHFTSLGDIREVVAASGLELEAVFADDGSSISPDTTDSHADNFTVLARSRTPVTVLSAR